MGLSFRRRKRGNVGGVETTPILVPEDPRSIPSAGLPKWVLTTPYVTSNNKDDVTSSDGTPDTITMMTSTGGVRGGITLNTTPQDPSLVKNNYTVLSEDVNNMASSSSSPSPVAALFPGTGGTGDLPRLRKVRGGNSSSSATTTNNQTKNVVIKNVSVKNDNNSNKETMRRIKSIKKGLYLTPPKKDTPNIHPTTHTRPRKVESSPTSVKSLNNGSNNHWNGNDVDVSSTFEIMYKQHNKYQAAVSSGRGGDCSISYSGRSNSSSGVCHANEQQSLLLLDKSSSPYKQHGLSGACTLSTVATSVTNYQPSTVVTTSSSTITTNNITYQQQQQQQQAQEQSLSNSSPPRLHNQNLSSLFERSMEEDDDDDYDNANDDTLPRPPSGNMNSYDDDDYDNGGGGNDANNNGTDAVVPLSDYSPLSSETSLKEHQQQQLETSNNTGCVLSLLKRRSSIVDGAAAGAYIKNKVLVVGGATQPSLPPLPPKNIIIAKTNLSSSSPVLLDMPSSVPKFINRSASDDISKTSTLTEPDYFHSSTNCQVPTTKPLRGTTTTTTTNTNTTNHTRPTPPKHFTSTDDADGISTSIVTSVIYDGQHSITLAMFGGSGTMMGADRLWDSVQHAFNVLDTICLPACSNISNGEKDMTNRCKSMKHLEEEDKFTPAFQNVSFLCGKFFCLAIFLLIVIY